VGMLLQRKAWLVADSLLQPYFGVEDLAAAVVSGVNLNGTRTSDLNERSIASVHLLSSSITSKTGSSDRLTLCKTKPSHFWRRLFRSAVLPGYSLHAYRNPS
jgi:D-hexose-6-phosphate mutarotase